MSVSVDQQQQQQQQQQTPPRQQLTLELVDTKGSGLTGSKHLEAVLHNFCPHPVRWKQVWHKSEATEPMFIWRAVPPSSKYVALGMVRQLHFFHLCQSGCFLVLFFSSPLLRVPAAMD